jgi:hypothetical protein
LGQLNLDPNSSSCLTRRAEGDPPAVGPSCWEERERAGKWRGRSIRRLARPSDEPNRLPLSIYKELSNYHSLSNLQKPFEDTKSSRLKIIAQFPKH